jgi:hypothetical protein
MAATPGRDQVQALAFPPNSSSRVGRARWRRTEGITRFATFKVKMDYIAAAFGSKFKPRRLGGG